MGLVGYSDSEDSGDDNERPHQLQKSSANSKATIQKLVDSTNPGKIRVSLPEPTIDNLETAGGPPAKKARVGGGFAGFNSFLPTPKKKNPISSGAGLTKTPGKGLGSGVSLKTGAAPGFSREPVSTPEFNGDASRQAEGDLAAQNDITEDSVTVEKAVKETVKIGNPMMFKPLSVARKTKRKKPVTPVASESLVKASSASGVEATSSEQVKPKKIQLFSMHTDEDAETTSQEADNEYTPMIYQAEVVGAAQDTADVAPTEEIDNLSSHASQSQQTLNSIASDLKLSASARRQLFGRGGQNSQAVNITNFNTDDEWKANEELRAAGEQPTHNPVRALVPGKHNIRQLMDAASNQKEAFEESFASGRRNKKESGNKYGW